MSIALALDVVMCILSVWMLVSSWREWQVRHHGLARQAEIIAVKHAIPTGWHKFHGRVDGSFDCDYVLVVSVEGKSPIELVVRSHMRILGGNRVFRYTPGDRVGVLYLEKYPKSVLPVEGSRGGGLAPVWLWGFCTATTFAIGLYMAVA